jgi:Asp-tRNA(Asn)/Glu-tRNA(Gln) amidotransferase A subunit family amidase
VQTDPARHDERAGELDPTSRTTPRSLTGWPAATVRAGTSSEGSPIDVQLVARPWRDDVAPAAALRVEFELGSGRLIRSKRHAATCGRTSEIEELKS